MARIKSLLGTTAGKIILLGLVGAGAYEASEIAHGQAKPSDLIPWSSPSQTPTGRESIEFHVKNAYQAPSGRLLLGDTEDYLDPNCHTVVVPAGIAKAKHLDSGLLGKNIKATGNKSTYKGKPQLVATDIAIK